MRDHPLTVYTPESPLRQPSKFVRDMIADASKGGARNVLVRLKSGDNIRFVAVRLGRA